MGVRIAINTVPIGVCWVPPEGPARPVKPSPISTPESFRALPAKLMATARDTEPWRRMEFGESPSVDILASSR